MTNELSDADLATLHGLIIAEAKRLGYGTRWHEDNHAQWPHRLKRLRTIARKILAQRGQ